ncbi:hypothetical protein FJY68_08480 [candidate division WOR-3 bacterium]|uniref:YncE family protein n=1 Tax=candidate division WOR-3 bacterium TaxID=2052148 RepID=A0A937XIU4_UNCW3|nr:hypothetical protein [candidate division WOR-3 bacterium]
MRRCVRGRDRNSLGSWPEGAKVLLCAVAMGAVLASAASGQVLEGQILLPDSLGPTNGNNHVAFDEDTVLPRIFIGGEGGDVIVADAVTCERFARIRSGPTNALCYVPAHNKLYVSTTDEYGVAVVDCNTYEVIKRLPFPSLVTGLYYNPRVDRVYCASEPLRVVDCKTDSVADSLPMNATSARCVLDDFRNKLYVGATDSLRVVDCSRDSVVASIYGLRAAQAVCFQPSAGKVYIAAGESLFALNTKADTVVYRRGFDTLYAQLACDPAHNRVYYTYWSHLIALDCDNDSILWDYNLWGRALSLAPVPRQNKLYVMLIALDYTWKYVLDGRTGQELKRFRFTAEDSLYYSRSTNRVFVSDHDYVVTALDGQADTLVGVVPLGVPVSNLVVDSVDNKLYFVCAYGNSVNRIGIVDCRSNKVRSYVNFSQVSREYWSLAHDSRDNKLYCSADSSILVYDCRTDSLIRRIGIDGLPFRLIWSPNQNKLYALSVYQDTSLFIAVVDCSRDTVSTIITLDADPDWIHGEALLTPEFDLLWLVSGGPRYCVIDCNSDSIVKDATCWGANAGSVSYSPAARRVYAAQYMGLCVFDVDTRLPIDSIPSPMRDSYYTWSRQVYCASRAGKVYWTIIVIRGYPPGVDSVFAVDARGDSVGSSFAVPGLSTSVCDDRTGDFVYFASQYLLVVDVRTDSVISGVYLPHEYASSLVPNRKTNRFYIAGGSYDDAIHVVYDSVVFAGVQEKPAVPARVARAQTLLSRGAPLRATAQADLYDASGRRAAALLPGPNDISHLPPGVYFVREEPQATHLKPEDVHKLVIAE